MSQTQAIYQMKNDQPIPTINLAAEYPLIAVDDLRDVLDAMTLLITSTGWGNIEFNIVNRSIETIHIGVTKKPRARKKPEIRTDVQK